MLNSFASTPELISQSNIGRQTHPILQKSKPNFLAANLISLLIDNDFHYLKLHTSSLFRLGYSDNLVRQYSTELLPLLDTPFPDRVLANETLNKIELEQIALGNPPENCYHALGGLLKKCFQNSQILNLQDVEILCSLNILIKQLQKIFKPYRNSITAKPGSISLTSSEYELIRICVSEFIGQLTLLGDILAATTIHNFLFIAQSVFNNQADRPDPLAYGVCIAPVLREGLNIDFKLALPQSPNDSDKHDLLITENSMLSHVAAALSTYPRFKQIYRKNRYTVYNQQPYYDVAFELISSLKIKQLTNQKYIIDKFKKLEFHFDEKLKRVEFTSALSLPPLNFASNYSSSSSTPSSSSSNRSTLERTSQDYSPSHMKQLELNDESFEDAKRNESVSSKSSKSIIPLFLQHKQYTSPIPRLSSAPSVQVKFSNSTLNLEDLEIGHPSPLSRTLSKLNGID